MKSGICFKVLCIQVVLVLCLGLCEGYNKSFWGKLSESQVAALEALETKYGVEGGRDCGEIFVSGMGGAKGVQRVMEYIKGKYSGTDFIPDCLALRKA